MTRQNVQERCRMISAGYSEKSVCTFADNGGLLGFIDASQGQNGTRGIAFAEDRALMNFDGEPIEIFYKNIKAVQIISSFEDFFADELSVVYSDQNSDPVSNKELRISDFSLDKSELKRLLDGLRGQDQTDKPLADQTDNRSDDKTNKLLVEQMNNRFAKQTNNQFNVQTNEQFEQQTNKQFGTQTDKLLASQTNELYDSQPDNSEFSGANLRNLPNREENPTNGSDFHSPSLGSPKNSESLPKNSGNFPKNRESFPKNSGNIPSLPLSPPHQNPEHLPVKTNSENERKSADFTGKLTEKINAANGQAPHPRELRTTAYETPPRANPTERSAEKITSSNERPFPERRPRELRTATYEATPRANTSESLTEKISTDNGRSPAAAPPKTPNTHNNSDSEIPPVFRRQDDFVDIVFEDRAPVITETVLPNSGIRTTVIEGSHTASTDASAHSRSDRIGTPQPDNSRNIAEDETAERIRIQNMSPEETLSFLAQSLNEINAPVPEPAPVRHPELPLYRSPEVTRRDNAPLYRPPEQERRESAPPAQTTTMNQAPQPRSAAERPVVKEEPKPAPLTVEPIWGDIYIKASRNLRELCESGRISMSQIETELDNKLLDSAKAFAEITADESKVPKVLIPKITELKAAAKNFDQYFQSGEDVAVRAMFFMLYQMLSYADRIVETPETKERLNDFFRRFGPAGITLSMLDMRV